MKPKCKPLPHLWFEMVTKVSRRATHVFSTEIVSHSFYLLSSLTGQHYYKARFAHFMLSHGWLLVTSMHLLSAQKQIKSTWSDSDKMQGIQYLFLIHNFKNIKIKFYLMFYRGGRGDAYQRVASIVTFIWKHTFARIGEDWVFLGLLGVIMALVSFLMDYTISMCNNARLWLVKDLVSNIYLQFVAWVLKFVFLISFSSCHASYFSTGVSSRLSSFVFNRVCPCCSSPGNSQLTITI